MEEKGGVEAQKDELSSWILFHLSLKACSSVVNPTSGTKPKPQKGEISKFGNLNERLWRVISPERR
jgi:hypothetical protein